MHCHIFFTIVVPSVLANISGEGHWHYFGHNPHDQVDQALDLKGGFGRQTGSDSARLKWLDMSCTHKSVDLSIWNLELSGIKS